MSMVRIFVLPAFSKSLLPNLDWRRALDNNEINAVILGRDFAQQMQASYAKDIAASDAIRLQWWSRRSLLLRTKEWASGLWAHLL